MRRWLVDKRAGGAAVAVASEGKLSAHLAQLLQPAKIIEGRFEHCIGRVFGAARAR